MSLSGYSIGGSRRYRQTSRDLDSEMKFMTPSSSYVPESPLMQTATPMSSSSNTNSEEEVWEEVGKKNFHEKKIVTNSI